MPTNLYGPNDNFDLESSHVLAALIRRFHEAKAAGADAVTLWGTGTPRREFLHVDDLADACIFCMNNYDEEPILNVGTGRDITIRELAETIRRIVGADCEIRWDGSRPDGTPRKLLDVSKLAAVGWQARISLQDGLEQTYRWFLQHQAGAE
jgi:GDP-L-fucose synthase